ncbi:MAG: nucleoside deaminase [Nitrospirae bacterium]|nr:MAG: nucleoside deaminase [Nitrospirota bacterium]
MAAAIAAAREGIATGQTPFGCAVVRAGEVVAAAHNTVWRDTDITAHAEVNGLRAACRSLGTIDLSGCDLYTTCEPCPMCLAAAHWARIRTVYFGATIADAAAAGFHELRVPAAELARLGGSPLAVVGGIEPEACRALFREWQASGRARGY